MMIHNAEIVIASDFEHEKVYAQILIDKEEFALITQEEDVHITFYPQTSGKPWNFKFDEMIEILTKAKAHLTQVK